MLKRFVIFAVLLSTLFVNTSAYCRFVLSFGGYTCELQNVTATNFSDIIDLSGGHIGGRTNEHVQRVEVSQTSTLTEIPAIIFFIFGNLEALSVSGNSLQRIYLPYCGPRMRELTIPFNSITLLQNGAFTGCHSIENLLLIGNNNLRIEQNVFDDLPLLRDIVMFNNQLDAVQGRWFRFQYGLQTLRLDQNALTSIQPGAFQCKEFLYDLDLRVNRLERIATGTFTNLPRLRTINLGTNSISVIEEGAFSNLPLLERLELVENQIAVLDSNLFGTSFPNLQYLGFGSNQINAVDRPVFRRFPALRDFFGVGNVCFSQNFASIELLENDVFPYLENCFINFDNF